MNVAIIPARGGSKGLPNKNILNLNGKPLIAYSIEVALACDFIDHVIVSTDSDSIASIAKRYGAEVPFMRPEELSGDTSTTIDVLKHAVLTYENMRNTEIKNIILLQPTSPLRTTENLKEAYQLYLENDSTPLVSVCETATHPFMVKEKQGKFLVDYIKDKPHVTRRQDFPILYELNGAIYITNRHYIMDQGKIYENEVLHYEMSKDSSIDIDDQNDFYLAEFIMGKRSVKNV